MTYREIFDLKFKGGYSTQELLRLYPKEAAKVREVALLEIPTDLLKETVSEGKILEKILFLKRRLGQPAV